MTKIEAEIAVYRAVGPDMKIGTFLTALEAIGLVKFDEAVPEQAKQSDPRRCTCHPGDNPPEPCAKQYALTACLRWGVFRRIVDETWNEATESTAVPSTDWADRIIAKALAANSTQEQSDPKEPQ